LCIPPATWPPPLPRAASGQRRRLRCHSAPFSGVGDASVSLGEDIDLLGETAHAFAEKEIAPRAHLIDRETLFPADLWVKIGEMGRLGLTIAVEYGRTGMGFLAHTVAMEEISRASASVGLSYGAHSNLAT